MAEARHGIRLAEPLNHWLRKSFDSGVGLTSGELSLLGDCMSAMESVSRHLDESSGFFYAHDSLRERDPSRRIRSRPPHRRARTPRSDGAAGAGVAVGVVQRTRTRAATGRARTAGDLSRTRRGAVRAMPPQARRRTGAGAAAAAGVRRLDARDRHRPGAVRCRRWNRTPITTRRSPRSSRTKRPSCSKPHSMACCACSPRQLARRARGAQRPLHTLKGGARMAGVVAMGDLAHEFESLSDAGRARPRAADRTRRPPRRPRSTSSRACAIASAAAWASLLPTR